MNSVDLPRDITSKQLELLAVFEVDEVSRLFKAVGDPSRILIVRALEAGSFGVLELCKILQVPQPRMSHHLKILVEAGILDAHREGTWIFYRRAFCAGEKAKQRVLRSLFFLIDEAVPLPDDVCLGIEKAILHRANQSREFFSKHGLRSQDAPPALAEFSAYREILERILDSIRTPRELWKLGVEIGPGNGDFLKVLMRHCESLVAVDNAPEMLELTKHTVDAELLDRLQFMTASAEQLPVPEASADFVGLNMVLHHIGSPGKAILECARILKNGGHAIVVDLCQHDQEWVRTHCGDLWLGFSTEILEEWAAVARLRFCGATYIGLRNGFQLQLILLAKDLST